MGPWGHPFLPLQLLFGCTKSKEFVKFREEYCGSFVPRMDRCCPQTLTWEVVKRATPVNYRHSQTKQFPWRAVGPTTKFAGLGDSGNLGVRLSDWSEREPGCRLTSDPVNEPGETFVRFKFVSAL